MAKKWIDSNEYPALYEFADSSLVEELEENRDPRLTKLFNQVEIPDEKVEWVTKVLAEFWEVQRYLSALNKDANQARQQ